MIIFTLSGWLSTVFVNRYMALACLIIAMVSSVFLVYQMIVTLGELLT
jgi:hypothetical protein